MVIMFLAFAATVSAQESDFAPALAPVPAPVAGAPMGHVSAIMVVFSLMASALFSAVFRL